MRTNELMLYKNMEYGEILQDMTFLMENFHNEYYNREDLRSLFFECMNAVSYTHLVSERLLPGIPEAIRAYNIRYSKKAILDRSAAGIRNHTLMVNLPEGAKSAKESLEYILPELVHVVEMLSL